MKRTVMIISAVLCCLLCLSALAVYAIPLRSQRVDWSLMTEGEQKAEDKGWTVYVIRDGKKILLEENNGRYAGCEAGETFYYSRTWDAEIAAPVLRIQAVMSAIAVWMDDELVYTDVPLDENNKERLILPILTADRADAVEISLHGELYGHTLTIAQASPMESETGYAYVFPCDVEVTGTYDYERSLITPANQTGLAELFLCITAMMLCYLACKREDGAILWLALLAFLRLLGVIASADFFYQYTTLWGMDFGVFVNRLSFSAMLGFLTLKCDKECFFMSAMAILHALATISALVVQAMGLSNDLFIFLSFLPDRLTLVFLMGVVILTAMQAHRKIPFFTLFFKLMTVFSVLGLLAGGVYLSAYTETWNRLWKGQVNIGILLRGAIAWMMQGAGIGAAVMLAVKELRAAREEKVFAAVRAQAVEQSYESLQQHQKDVMILRHDMKRHDLALKGFLDAGDTARAKEYLSDILEEQEQIPQTIHTDNALMNILLGSRIAAAERMGLQVEIRRMDVPAKLPLSDKEMVSLVLNIVDNAIEAAKRAQQQPALLRLDMHQKNGLFVFICENTMPEDHATIKEAPLNSHGYGLHIIEHILEPHGNLMNTQIKDGCFCVTVALPLK